MSEAIPRLVKDAVRPWRDRERLGRYEANLRRAGITPGELLILGTVTKGGTHYMRFMLANYIQLLADRDSAPASGQDVNRMFPNAWHHAYLNRTDAFREPTPLLGAIGLYDVPRSHTEYWVPYWYGSPVLHLYRNPLDYAVFAYYFKYEYLPELAGTLKGPLDVLEADLDEFAGLYTSYRRLAKEPRANLLRFSYEQLVAEPARRLDEVLRWLGVDVDDGLVRRAVDHTQTVAVVWAGGGEKWMWSDDLPKPQNPAVREFTELAVEHGTVGRWRDFFTPSDVARVERSLANYDIRLSEFTLEP